MRTCSSCAAPTEPSARFCVDCGERLEVSAAARQRKTVTVVFCGLVTTDGAARGLESMRDRARWWYRTAKDVFTEYGGQVEQHVTGEPVVAVFGIPAVKEDDAVRAVRAVDRLGHLVREPAGAASHAWEPGLRLRVGVHTGEVFTNATADREPFAFGDPMNVAARLQEAARPGEVLISHETWQLVRRLTETERRPPLAARGRDDAVLVHELRAVHPADARPPRLFDTPIVGRAAELELLELVYRRAVKERGPHLVTILGQAGVGKSRLMAEFERRLAGQATVWWGRCLNYGQDITYWPMVEIVSRAAGIRATDGGQLRRAKLADLVTGEQPQAAAGLAHLFGLGKDKFQAATVGALRHLFESSARRRPLIIVIDDLHWAKRTLLDTIEYLTEWSHDAPLMVVCMARPELLEHEPSWGGGRADSVLVSLSALSEAETGTLIDWLQPAGLDEATRLRIGAIADGNPLFTEEIVAMLAAARSSRSETLDAAGGAPQPIRIPPTIQALLAARLDQLSQGEQTILERAAVVGKQFQRAAILALADLSDRPSVTGHLGALVRKGLLLPDPGGVMIPIARDDGYRFRHLLIRDAAYQRLPKGTRAALHERFADWLEQVARSDPVQDEFVGNHLEQAHQYLEEVDPGGDHHELAERAARKLAAAGRRAAARGDIPATRSLLTGAVALLPRRDPARAGLLFDLAVANQRGGDLAGALLDYDEIIGGGPGADAAQRMYAELGRLEVRWHSDLDRFISETPEVVERARALFSASKDDLGLAMAWRLAAELSVTVGRAGAAAGAIELAMAAVKRARELDPAPRPEIMQWEARIAMTNCFALYWGPLHNSAVEAYLKERSAWAARNGAGRLEATATGINARVAAMLGRFDDAKALLAASRAKALELGDALMVSLQSFSAGLVEFWAADLHAAERELRAGQDALKAMQAKASLSVVTTLLARVLLEQESLDEAERLTQVCEEISAPGDVALTIGWKGVRAVLLARQGARREADALATEVAALAEQLEEPESCAWAFADLAEVHARADRLGDARAAAAGALALHERKGNLVGARDLQRLLRELG